ncbi:MBL fold metallo-hydrolase [Parvularcula sp. LCG005]|uniref:MBL fold metallo-hydrolase n=1 Tax=Parvularcula sp. LCG005 TaxID=3078805 RepID=UPI002941BEBB|nr:MBL fold metallo-hydrolase [Parvularcula sp. LCG005]WOI54081.1 MBL fold metallo-hydrolase [Parvularcula sp. LCG005]
MTSIIALIAATTAMTAHPAVSHDTKVMTAAAAVTQQQATPASKRQDLGDGLYAIMGRGGNILFSTGPDGVFVIDDQFADIAKANLDLIKQVSDMPVVFVLNTHFHGDHTGGNAAFYNAGATIVAHDNVRARLAEQAKTGDLQSNALPVITFSEEATFHWNGKTIHVVHVPNAHTDGDAIVHFVDANLIHTGDTLFSGRYPFIDINSGGSVEGVLAALNKVASLSNAETTIVPGHGPVSNRQDVRDTIAMIRKARRMVRAEMMKGSSREDVIAADPLADMNRQYAWDFINGEKMTGQLFDDLMNTDNDASAAVKKGPAQPAAAPAAPPVTPAPAAETPAPAAETPATEDAPASDDTAEPAPAGPAAPPANDAMDNKQPSVGDMPETEATPAAAPLATPAPAQEDEPATSATATEEDASEDETTEPAPAPQPAEDATEDADAEDEPSEAANVVRRMTQGSAADDNTSDEDSADDEDEDASDTDE